VPRISVVIPAWNEEAYLPRLLDSVDAARARFPGGSEQIEVVVADNASTDRTAEIAAARGCRVVRVEKRVIAAARNGGAAAARGAIIAFVDADSTIHPDTFDAIERAMAGRRFAGGATGVHMERVTPGVAAAFAMMIWLVWATGMDTGVVFCRRADFEALGGYDESRLFGEDVKFLWRLRRLGKGRGERLVRLRGVKAVTSVRKWESHGDWYYVLMLLRAPVLPLLSRGYVERMVRRIWYEGRGPRNPPSASLP